MEWAPRTGGGSRGQRRSIAGGMTPPATPGVFVGASSVGTGTYSGFAPNKFAAPSDLGTGDGTSEANAMDWPTALAGLVAGDILGLTPGVYSATSDTGGSPTGKFTAPGSGTSGSPIRIAAKYPAVYLSTPGANANRSEFLFTNPQANGQPYFSFDSRDYIQLWGIYLDEADVPPRASHGSIKFLGTTGSRIEECYFDVREQDDSDNFAAVFCQSNTNGFIRNCKFKGLGTSTGSKNESTITVYSSVDLRIEHCEFEDVNVAVFVKGNVGGGENSGHITLCKFTGLTNAAVVLNYTDETNRFRVFQNLMLRCEFSINYDDSGDPGLRWSDVYNNTSIDAQNCDVYFENPPIQDGSSLYDNIFYRTTNDAFHFVIAQDDPAPNVWIGTGYNYNNYYKVGGTPSWRTFDDGAAVNYTILADWRTACGAEANSTNNVQPTFADVGADDYRISGAALTAGHSGGPIGCYLTQAETIGLEA